MDFLRARTKEQIEQRQLDIMQACDALFEEGGYENVNIKAISEMTAIKRSSIYTYYKTKDEIILDLLREELLQWQEELLLLLPKRPTLSKAEFAKMFTEMLMHKDKMLQYYCLLYSFLEINCGLLKIVAFKKSIMPIMGTLVKLLQAYFPEYETSKALLIVEEILSYVLGLYPSTHLTDKQKDALARSQTGYQASDFATLCQHGIASFLNN